MRCGGIGKLDACTTCMDSTSTRLGSFNLFDNGGIVAFSPHIWLNAFLRTVQRIGAYHILVNGTEHHMINEWFQHPAQSNFWPSLFKKFASKTALKNLNLFKQSVWRKCDRKVETIIKDVRLLDALTESGCFFPSQTVLMGADLTPRCSVHLRSAEPSTDCPWLLFPIFY